MALHQAIFSLDKFLLNSVASDEFPVHDYSRSFMVARLYCFVGGKGFEIVPHAFLGIRGSNLGSSILYYRIAK